MIAERHDMHIFFDRRASYTFRSGEPAGIDDFKTGMAKRRDEP
jgi:hypothetical protein